MVTSHDGINCGILKQGTETLSLERTVACLDLLVSEMILTLIVNALKD